MGDLNEILAPNTAWSADGDARFFRTLARLAAGNLRVTFLAQNASACAAEGIIRRTREAGISAPIILFSKPLRGRFAPYIEEVCYARGVSGHATADWPDAAVVRTCDGQQHWAIHIRNGKVEVTR